MVVHAVAAGCDLGGLDTLLAGVDGVWAATGDAGNGGGTMEVA